MLCFVFFILCYVNISTSSVLSFSDEKVISYSEPTGGDPSHQQFTTAAHGGAAFAFPRLRPVTADTEQTQAVTELVQRLMPAHTEHVHILVNRSLLDEAGRDQFDVTAADGELHVRGSTGVAAAWAVLHYLKYACAAHVSWDGDQLQLPEQLPAASYSVRAADRFRYYQNVCTVSYSSVWWDWPRWERELDWMALNGVNLALAFTGQEVLWRRVFTSIGLTDQEVDGFFTGPAFLAWNRMGNLKRWGGGLSAAWHGRQLALAHRIIARMRQLGITPVLPAFAGHVPDNFTRAFPNSTVYRLGGWSNFNQTYSYTGLLDPTDAMFATVGRLFVAELEAEFNGTEHVYNCDSFNEMAPPSGEAGYLQAAGAATLQAMTDADPDAVWLMQGWLFLSDFWTQERAKAYLTSVPIGRMIVLDLASEHRPIYNRMESYFGQPFVWCMLHNFGGQQGMRGPLETVIKGPFAGRSFPNSSMVGTGLTMEGIFQNYVIYDLMLEMGWRQQPPQPLQWAAEYAARRYGPVSNPDLLAHAWQLLMRSVYNGTSGRPDGGPLTFYGAYIFTNRPHLSPQAQPWFRLSDLVAAWSALLAGGSADDYRGSVTLRHDAADVTREALSQLVAGYHRDMLDAFQRADHLRVQEMGALILECYGDLDRALETTDNFLLGRWLHEAITIADNPEDARQFEYNARNQVTLWGPSGEIADYAAKQWAGLLRDYYRPRWRLFTEYLVECLLNNSTYKQSEVNQRFLERVERPFTLQNSTYPHTPSGDTYSAVRAIYEKYLPALRRLAGPDRSSAAAARPTLVQFQPLPDTSAPGGHVWEL